MKENRAFEEMKKAALQRLHQKDPGTAAKKAGVLWDAEKQEWEVESLGETVRISLSTGEVRPALDEWQILLLLHYLDMADGAPIEGEWMTFGRLKDGLIRGTGFDRTTDAELGKFLKGKEPVQLECICGSLGGVPCQTKADFSVELPLFPRYPLLLKVWFADEEFPASGKLLVNGQADHYLTVEDAVTAGELLLRKLWNAAE